MNEKRALEDWHTEIGLGRDAASIAENAISWDVLAQFNDDDLKQLALPLGDRRRFLLTGPGDPRVSGIAASKPSGGLIPLRVAASPIDRCLT